MTSPLAYLSSNNRGEIKFDSDHNCNDSQTPAYKLITKVAIRGPVPQHLDSEGRFQYENRISLRHADEFSSNHNIKELHAAGTLWKAIRQEVKLRADFEPIMSTFFHGSVLNHETIEGSLSFILASKLDSPVVSSMAIREIIEQAYASDPSIIHAAEIDIKGAPGAGPGVRQLLYAASLLQGIPRASGTTRRTTRLGITTAIRCFLLLQSQMNMLFGVDIHPAAIS